MSEHNHAFLPENQRHLIRCGMMILDPSKGVLDDMAKASIVNFSHITFWKMKMQEVEMQGLVCMVAIISCQVKVQVLQGGKIGKLS